MNKVIVYCLVACLMLSLSCFMGCSKTDAESQSSTTEEALVSYVYQIQQIKDSTSYPGSIVEYPQLSNVNNDYSDINQSILDAINAQMEYITDRGSVESAINLTYSITYREKDLLCVLFEGVSSAEHAAHPANFAFSICLSVEAGEIIDPITFLDISPEFLTEFREQLPNQGINNNRFDSEQWESIVSYINSFSDEELKEVICSELNSTVALQEESILILFPVPRAAGDYVKISVPLYYSVAQGSRGLAH